jgi:hypothetical protein
MITEIYLEGNRLDLFQDLGADLTYVIDDIKDFSSRNTSYSKTINIPGNANNNKIFGHIYDLNISNNYGYNTTDPNFGYNFNPSKHASCIIYHNKIQIFKGIIRLLEITINKGMIEYQCSVFGELGGFASAIGNSLIEDLNGFEVYNQTWTEGNVVNSWNASGGTGIVFPLIDYGNCKNNAPDYHLDAFRPSFFVYEILNKIISTAGYTYESSFMNTAIFKNLIIPNNKADLEEVVSDLLNAQCFNQTTTSTDYLFVFGSISQYLFTNTSGSTFTFIGTTGTSGTMSLKGTGLLRSTKNVTVHINLNGAPYYNIVIPQTGNVSTTFSIDVSFPITLTNNDYFTVDFTTAAGLNPNFSFTSQNIVFDFTATNGQTIKANYGASLNMKNLLPKGILQKDFFVSICRMFNLYIWEDPGNTKKLYIEPYVDFYQINGGQLKINDFGELLLHGEPGDSTGLLLLSDPTVDALQWNDKLDYSQTLSIKPMSELNARFYKFSYADDDDFYTEAYKKKYTVNYGDRKEDTGYEFANDEHETNIIFAPGVLVGRSGDQKIAMNIFKSSAGVEERKDHVIRIALFKKITGVPTYHINNLYPNNGNLSTQTSYGYAGHLDHPTTPSADISFGVPKEILFTISSYPTTNLFTSFWTDYLGEITGKDSKLLTCYLYLTIEDIYKLDFSKFIYLNGSLWRLNKIEDFNPNASQTTKVELLKVLETTYAG